MEETCDICLGYNSKVSPLNTLFVEDIDDGVHLHVILSELLLQDFSDESTTNICEVCTSSVLNYVLFKRRIERNLQFSTLQRLKVRKNVDNFLLRHKNEKIISLDFPDPLHLVPATQEELVKGILLQNQSLQEVPPTESTSPTVALLNVSAQLDEPIDVNINNEPPGAESGEPNEVVKAEQTFFWDYYDLSRNHLHTSTSSMHLEIAQGSNQPSDNNCGVHVFLRSMDDTAFGSLLEKVSHSYRIGCCVYCSKAFTTDKANTSLRFHIVSKHLMSEDLLKPWLKEKIDAGKNIHGWLCVLCGKLLISRQGIHIHLVRHLERDFDRDWNDKLDSVGQ